jgi:hypothetical protein
MSISGPRRNKFATSHCQAQNGETEHQQFLGFRVVDFKVWGFWIFEEVAKLFFNWNLLFFQCKFDKFFSEIKNSPKFPNHKIGIKK